ncbi:unnamed protein product [Cyprideis torosa]|uniref:Uncharacterized protein n=1 Tax=Cyprideis torosa TaxID=163714 RepID=A0A7R8ZKM2_9CRUS|nr:unnamed protein product [Cyprideis torosa]CAG0881968.1 unnamed protein product [Cyprideis torosa]
MPTPPRTPHLTPSCDSPTPLKSNAEGIVQLSVLENRGDTPAWYHLKLIFTKYTDFSRIIGG